MDYQTYMHSIESGAIECTLKPNEIRNFTEDDFETAKTLFYGFADYRCQVKSSSEYQTSNSETDTDYENDDDDDDDNDDDDVQLIEIVPKRKFEQLSISQTQNRIKRVNVTRKSQIIKRAELPKVLPKKGINSFMLFAKVHRPIASNLKKIQNRDISIILSEWWNACDKKSKKVYIDFAAEIKEKENNASLKTHVDKALKTFPRFDYRDYEANRKENLNLTLAQIEDAIAAYREKQNAHRSQTDEVANNLPTSSSRINIDQQRRLIIGMFNEKLYPGDAELTKLQGKNPALFPKLYNLKIMVREIRQRLMNMKMI